MNQYSTVRIRSATKHRLGLEAHANRQSVCGLLEEIVLNHYLEKTQPSVLQETLLEQIRVSTTLLEQIRLVGIN